MEKKTEGLSEALTNALQRQDELQAEIKAKQNTSPILSNHPVDLSPPIEVIEEIERISKMPIDELRRMKKNVGIRYMGDVGR